MILDAILFTMPQNSQCDSYLTRLPVPPLPSFFGPFGTFWSFPLCLALLSMAAPTSGSTRASTATRGRGVVVSVFRFSQTLQTIKGAIARLFLSLSPVLVVRRWRPGTTVSTLSRQYQAHKFSLPVFRRWSTDTGRWRYLILVSRGLRRRCVSAYNSYPTSRRLVVRGRARRQARYPSHCHHITMRRVRAHMTITRAAGPLSTSGPLSRRRSSSTPFNRVRCARWLLCRIHRLSSTRT